MKWTFSLIGMMCCLNPLWAVEPTPQISHEAPGTVVAGQPLQLVARVRSAQPVKEVHLHLAQSAGAAPTVFPMQPSGAGVYAIRVEPKWFAGVTSFRYYLVARTEKGAWSETPWSTVNVIGSAPAQASAEGEWVRPAVIGGGVALAVGAGVALSGGSGGGGDGDSGGDDTDPADQLVVRSVSDQVDSDSPGLPRSVVVDATDELGGRTVRRARIRLDFDARDAGAEQVQILYNGAVVLSAEVSGTLSDQVDVLGAEDSRVTIRVLTSEFVEGNSAYSWSSTVTYFLE